MPRLSRRRLRIPNLRYKGQSISDRNRRSEPPSPNLRDNTVPRQSLSDRSPISDKPIPTPQHKLKLENDPLFSEFSEDDLKDVSHQWTDALRQHYLKNMNSMNATTNISGRTSHDDDDTSITPIMSNCNQVEKYNITQSLATNVSDDMLSTVTPIMSNCHNSVGETNACSSVDASTRASTFPITEETSLESDESEISPRRKNTIDRVNCVSILEEIVLPVLVMILYFIAFLLSSFSSLSCQFMTCNLDFIPININIGQTDLNVGPWAFLALTGDGDNFKCLRYPNDFSEAYIKTDSSWKATRATSVLTIVIGWTGFLVIGLAVSKIKMFVSIRWIHILDKYWKVSTIGTSTLLIALECVMFTFQSVDMCKDDKMWMRDDGKFLAADKCSLSTGAFYSMFAMVLYGFVMLLLIFAPVCPSMCVKNRRGENVEEYMSLDVRRDNLVVEEHRYSSDNYAIVSDDSSKGSFDSVEISPQNDTDLKKLESKKFSIEPAVSSKSNITSRQMGEGDVEMQQMKTNDSSQIRRSKTVCKYDDGNLVRQCDGRQENVTLVGLLDQDDYH